MRVPPPRSHGKRDARALSLHGYDLIRAGYHILPVLAHDAATTAGSRLPGAGKAPSIRLWQELITTPRDLVRFLRDKRVAGIGFATGRQSGICGVDVDVLDELASLEIGRLAIDTLGTAPIRIGRSPKRLIPYRIADPIRKIAGAGFTFPGLADVVNRVEILGHPGHFVGYGIHPTTLNPYFWTDPTGGAITRGLLDVPPGDLPLVTVTQLEEFLEAAAGILRNHGGEPVGAESRGAGRRTTPFRRAPREGASAASESRAAKTPADLARVLDALARIPNDAEDYDSWLDVCYGLHGTLRDAGTLGTAGEWFTRYQIAWEDWSARSPKNTPRATAQQWDTIHDQAVIRAGAGTIYRRARAAGWVPQDGGGTSDPDPGTDADEPIPHLPHPTLTLDEAVDSLRDLVTARVTRLMIDRDPHTLTATARAFPPQIGIQVGIGIGKTHAALEAIIPALRAGRRIAYVVPTQALADEAAARAAEFAGEEAFAVWRGISRPDPDGPPGSTMCRYAEAAEVWTSAGWDLGGLCSSCPYHPRRAASRGLTPCGYQVQKRIKAVGWIVPSAMLPRAAPKAISAGGPLDGLVIDEAFWGSLLGGMDDDADGRDPYQIDVAHLTQSRFVVGTVAADAVAAIAEAIEDHSPGEWAAGVPVPFLGAAAADRGVTVEIARELQSREWDRKIQMDRELIALVRPMSEREARRALRDQIRHNSIVSRCRRFWTSIETILTGDIEDATPALELVGVGSARAIRMRWLTPIHADWTAPTLYLDGTMLVGGARRSLPRLVVDPPIRADHTPEQGTVEQIVGWRGASSSLVDAASGESTPTRALLRIGRHAELLAWQHRSILVIGQLAVVTELRAAAGQAIDRAGVVHWGHFGALRGIDAWARVDAVLVVGRVLPDPAALEVIATILYGRQVARIPDGQWYPQRSHAVRVRVRPGAQPAATSSEYHPDPDVEELRRAVCEDEILQAIGRARAIRRNADHPVRIVVAAGYAVDVPVDEVTRWADGPPEPDMRRLVRARLLEGTPTSWADVSAAMRDVIGDHTGESGDPGAAARKWFRGALHLVDF